MRGLFTCVGRLACRLDRLQLFWLWRARLQPERCQWLLCSGSIICPALPLPANEKLLCLSQFAVLAVPLAAPLDQSGFFLSMSEVIHQIELILWPTLFPLLLLDLCWTKTTHSLVAKAITLYFPQRLPACTILRSSSMKFDRDHEITSNAESCPWNLQSSHPQYD